MHWILFIISVGSSGVVTHTQEFTTLDNCNAAVVFYNTEVFTKKNKDLGLLGEVHCFEQ